MIRTNISAALACLAITAFTAAAAERLSPADKRFMTAAADDDMIEAHIGQMAESKAVTANVKDFAKKLAEDHSKAYGELLQLAQQTGESIPRGIDIRKNRAAAQLTRFEGARFDRAFLRDEIADHEKALAEFQREAAHGTNPDVKAWASKMIPVLKEHLNMARELEKSVESHKTAAKKV